MKLSDRVSIPPQVMARTVGEETVILDLASGTYFGLDSVGARIWQLMGEGRTLAEVCDRMLDEYDVEREALERDLFDLLEALAGQNLVEKPRGG
jgi:hypothetical protein